MLKLVGYYDSPFVRRTAAVLNVLNLDFENIELSVWQESEKVRSISPLSRVPILQFEDGRILNDSNVIIDHMVRIHGQHTGLLPTEMGEYHRVSNLIGFGMGLMEKLAQLYTETKIREPELVSEKLKVRYEQQIGATLAFLEKELKPADTNIQTPSVLNITLSVALQFMLNIFDEQWHLDKYPKLKVITEKMENHPALLNTYPW
jgi:glutathione S-transferase